MSTSSYEEDYFSNSEDFVNNPSPRVPVCLCLDTSGSMQGKPIEELNEGIKTFYYAIKNDEIAVLAAEIAIVTFGFDGIKKVEDFSTIENKVPPVLKARGYTPMGEGVNLALDLLENRKVQYKNAGIDYYQPWLVLMTDGRPTGDENELMRAIKRTNSLIKDKKLTIFPIAIGADADMKVLKDFSPKRQPLMLKGLNFKDFFVWLSKSVSTTSQSIPGDKVPLDLEGLKGWAEI